MISHKMHRSFICKWMFTNAALSNKLTHWPFDSFTLDMAIDSFMSRCSEYPKSIAHRLLIYELLPWALLVACSFISCCSEHCSCLAYLWVIAQSMFEQFFEFLGAHLVMYLSDIFLLLILEYSKEYRICYRIFYRI